MQQAAAVPGLHRVAAAVVGSNGLMPLNLNCIFNRLI